MINFVLNKFLCFPSILFVLVILSNKSIGAVSPFAPEVLEFRNESMIAIKPFIEYFKWNVIMDGKLVTIKQGEHLFSFSINSNVAQANGKTIKLNMAPFNLNGASYVPLEPLTVAMGGVVEYGNDSCMLDFPENNIKLILNSVQVPDDFYTYNGHIELYISNLDGSGYKRLTYTAESPLELPAITRNGNTFVYRRGNSIYTRATSSIQESLLVTVEDKSRGGTPIIDPEGNLIIWPVTTENEKRELWLIRTADPKAIRKIPGKTPVFSTDGELVAFSAPGENDIDTVYLMNNTGDNIKPLGRGFSPHFSPDNTLLVWSILYGNNCESLVAYYIAGPHAGNAYALKQSKQLTDSEFFQSFSADGNKIICGWGHGITGASITQAIYMISPDRSSEPQYQQIDGEKTFRVQYDPLGKCMLYYVKNQLKCRQLQSQMTMTLASKMTIWDFAITPDSKSVLFIASPLD